MVAPGGMARSGRQRTVCFWPLADGLVYKELARETDTPPGTFEFCMRRTPYASELQPNPIERSGQLRVCFCDCGRREPLQSSLYTLLRDLKCFVPHLAGSVRPPRWALAKLGRPFGLLRSQDC